MAMPILPGMPTETPTRVLTPRDPPESLHLAPPGALVAEMRQNGVMERPRMSVEDKIRAAQKRGAFDNLPGAGKPLDLGDLNDPNWFVKGLIKREKIDPSELAHPTIRLRREAESFPASLAEFRNETDVRAVLEDFNERVKAEWRRPAVGPSLPVIARTVSVERMVERWRENQERVAEQAQRAAAELALAAPIERVRARRWWWPRSRRRRA
jgi:hypothetical protein